MNIFTVVQSLFSQIDSKTHLHENSDEKLQSFRVSVRYMSEHCAYNEVHVITFVAAASCRCFITCLCTCSAAVCVV